jgi:hypothetical protein
MKKSKEADADDMRKEYDFSKLGPGVRGKYAQQLKDVVLVPLDAEIAQAFPTSKSVNQALRSVLEARKRTRRVATVARRVTRPSTVRKK